MLPFSRSTTLLFFAALLLLTVPATAQDFAQDFDYDYEEVIDRSFTVTPGQQLTLEAERGSVTVRGSEGNRVVVKVLKGVDNVDEDEAAERFARYALSFDQTAGGVEIEGRLDDDSRWWRKKRLRVHFEIAVPRTFDVSLKTSGGSVYVETLRGEASLRTSGGSVTALDIEGPLTANTSGGSVFAERIGGDTDLHTSGGAITAKQIKGTLNGRTSGGTIFAEQISGDVTAHTSGGSVTLKAIYGTVDAQTSGGSIEAHLAMAPDGPVRLKTSGGSITLRLPENATAEIDAQASGGRVRTDLPVSIIGEMKRGRLRGTLGGGGPLLTLRSSGGGIYIAKQ